MQSLKRDSTRVGSSLDRKCSDKRTSLLRYDVSYDCEERYSTGPCSACKTQLQIVLAHVKCHLHVRFRARFILYELALAAENAFILQSMRFNVPGWTHTSQKTQSKIALRNRKSHCKNALPNRTSKLNGVNAA
jgi:hypothetical protein